MGRITFIYYYIAQPRDFCRKHVSFSLEILPDLNDQTLETILCAQSNTAQEFATSKPQIKKCLHLPLTVQKRHTEIF